MSENVITSYKGFDKDMKCRGFQYEVGKEYNMNGEIKCCNRGFHACKSPLEVWDYYDMLNSRFAEVEQSGKIDEEEKSTKVCSSRIKIKAELKLADIINIGVEWLRDITSPSKVKTDGALNDNGDRNKQIGSSGDSAKIGSSGDSPLRLLEFDIKMYGIPYWVSNHFVRHVHAQPFVSTSRPDITGSKVSRHDMRQDELVNLQLSLNAQEIINISKLRLCYKASYETRKIWMQVVEELGKIEPHLAAACVPQCIYRGFCPESKSCGKVDTHVFPVYRENYKHLFLIGER